MSSGTDRCIIGKVSLQRNSYKDIHILRDTSTNNLRIDRKTAHAIEIYTQKMLGKIQDIADMEMMEIGRLHNIVSNAK